jgi:hypothetical protein
LTFNFDSLSIYAHKSIHPSNVVFLLSYISGISEAMLMGYWHLIQFLLSPVSTMWSLWTPYTLDWTFLRVKGCLRRLWKWNLSASCTFNLLWSKPKAYVVTFVISLGYVGEVNPSVVLPRDLEWSQHTYITYNRTSQRNEFDFDTRDVHKSLWRSQSYFLRMSERMETQ